MNGEMKMHIEKEFLVQSAARLYSLGIDLENARNKLHQLVEAKVPYDSPKMMVALRDFNERKAEWEALEKYHLSLRTKFQQKIDPD